MSVPGNRSFDPRKITGMDQVDVLELLDRIDESISPRMVIDLPSKQGSSALVLGDTHGDWPTLEYLVTRHGPGSDETRFFVTLGDYVDRTPREVRFGSVANMIYVLSLVSGFPGSFVALRGNHEGSAHVPIGVSEMETQSLQLWGTREVSLRIERILEKLPIAVITESGAFMAHGGFPMSREWRASLENPTEETWFEVLWNDVDASEACGNRGIDQPAISEKTLSSFLERSGLSVVIRGHDPSVAGQIMYGGRLVTVHTTRTVRGSKLVMARIPLEGRLKSIEESMLIRFDPPPIG